MGDFLPGYFRKEKTPFLMNSFPSLRETHKSHIISVHFIKYLLSDVYKVDASHIRSQGNTSFDIDTYDAVITAGGDGTYLEAAFNIRPHNKWSSKKNFLLFGVNTDPKRSEGHLLMKCETPIECGVDVDNFMNNKLPSILKDLDLSIKLKTDTRAILTHVNHQICRIFTNKYTPIARRRIRVTLKMSDYQIVKSTSHEQICSPLRTIDKASSNSTAISSHPVQNLANPNPKYNINLTENQYLAVNEIFMSNEQSHATLYVEYSVDSIPLRYSKNSGVLVCTGSGSTAWAFNISKVSQSAVESVIRHFIDRQPSSVKPNLKEVNIEEICTAVNKNLVFSSSSMSMRLVLREPVQNRIFSVATDSIKGKKITLRPLTKNTIICLDGLKVIPIQFGQTVMLNIDNDDDIILTAV